MVAFWRHGYAATTYRSLENYPDGETYPGLLMVRFNGSLFFANAPDFADEIREGVAAFEPQVVLVDCESITSVDATAIIVISKLSDELTRTGVELRFARVRETVIDVIRRSEEGKTLDPESFYISVQAGVDAYLFETDSSTES